MALTRITSQDIKDNVIVNIDINASAAIATTKLADGSVDNTEFQRLGVPTSALASVDDVQAFTNKTITATSNTVAAKSLHSLTTVVNVASATAPSNGQVLTATSSTAATWQTPAGGLAVANFKFNEIPSVLPNGTIDIFPLVSSAASTGVVCVHKNGIRQSPGTTMDFMHLGVTGIQFNAGNIPETGDNLLLDYIT